MVCCALACASPTSRVAFDAGENFQRFRTWNWYVSDAPRADAPRDDARRLAGRVGVRGGRGLEQRGFRRDVIAPDFLISFHVSLQPRLEQVAVPRAPQHVTSFNAHAYWIEGTTWRNVPYDAFSLAIEVGTPDGDPIWRGATQSASSPVGSRRSRPVSRNCSSDFPRPALLRRSPRARTAWPPSGNVCFARPRGE